MSPEERKRRSLAAKRSPAMHHSKARIPHGKPELTQKILKELPEQVDRIKKDKNNGSL